MYERPDEVHQGNKGKKEARAGLCRKGYEMNGSKAKGRRLYDWARLKLTGEEGGKRRREQGGKEGMRDGMKRENIVPSLPLLNGYKELRLAMNKSPIKDK